MIYEEVYLMITRLELDKKRNERITAEVKVVHNNEVIFEQTVYLKMSVKEEMVFRSADGDVILEMSLNKEYSAVRSYRLFILCEIYYPQSQSSRKYFYPITYRQCYDLLLYGVIGGKRIFERFINGNKIKN